MKRILAAVASAAVAVPLLSAPASAHETDPAFSGCLSRGGQLAAAVTGQWDDPADRNDDGVVCWYLTEQGDFRTADNHLHLHGRWA